MNKLLYILILIATAFGNSAAWAVAGNLDLSETNSSFVVNTGGGLVFEIAKRGGDLTSLKYNGRECEAPFDLTKRYSHYASGLSASSQVTADKAPAGQWIKITVDDEQTGVTQYYIARRGEANIYMATYAEKLPSPGEMRYIVYLSREVFPLVPVPSDISLANSGIEGKDVFKNSTTGTTYSKFYGVTPIIDGEVHGVTGAGIGCYFNLGNRETSSGGPFFRDIQDQSSHNADEFYNYMYSGHTQTEPFRAGLKGPSALQFTDGQSPAAPDYSFIQQLHLNGCVPSSERGALSGRVSGVPHGDRETLALANTDAQYWTNPDASGQYTIKNILPGTYTATLYDVELAVASRTVTITARQTASADVATTLFIPPAIFRIGKWDGTPYGFLNASKIGDHHPSDRCMAPFKDMDFVIGQTKDPDWPLAQWRDVNNNLRITFPLTEAQARTPLTFRVGITWAYMNGRPRIEVNAGTPQAWTSAVPQPSVQPTKSRGITRGTFRGNNYIFAFDVPPSSLRAGANTIVLHVEGEHNAYPGFLSPCIVFDAVDLVTTADAERAAASAPQPYPLNKY